GREVPFQRFAAFAGVGRLRHPLAEPERVVAGQVAETEHRQQRQDADDDRSRAPPYQLRHPLPPAESAWSVAIRRLARTRESLWCPEGALAEDRQQRRQQGE